MPQTSAPSHELTRARLPIPRLNPVVGIAAIVGLLIAPTACSGGNAQTSSGSDSTDSTAAQDETPERKKSEKPPVLKVEVVERYKHDRKAYTQGLLIEDGKLYESTGKEGESGVRLVDLKTGEVLKERKIPGSHFGEGLAAVGDLLYQLTWKNRTVHVFDRKSLRKLGYTYDLEDQGWGLTSHDGELVMSDGTATITFLDPKGFKEIRRIEVTDEGKPVLELNELEWIDDEIWANVWKTDRIARIDPKTGKVTSWLDLTGILKPERVNDPREDVLNGIAYDEETEKIYVTGKRWPSLFEIRVIEEEDGD